MIADIKPYPRMKEAGLPWVGMVPEHWSLVPNRAMLRRRKTSVGDRHTEYQLLSLTKAGLIIRDVSTGRGKFSADMGSSQEVRVGDLVFCFFDIPETPRTIGLSKHDGMITGAYTVFECPDEHLRRFLEAFYISMDDRKLLSPLYSGLRHTIPPSTFLGVKTPIPPRSEQVAIVRFLDYLDRRIRRYIRAKQKLIKLLEEKVTVKVSEAMRHPACKVERIGRIAVQQLRPITRKDSEQYVALGVYNRGRGPFHKPPTAGSDLGASTFSWVEPGDLVISGQFGWEEQWRLPPQPRQIRLLASVLFA